MTDFMSEYPFELVEVYPPDRSSPTDWELREQLLSELLAILEAEDA